MPIVLPRGLQHHDPALVGHFAFLQAEEAPQIDHRNHRAAKVDQALHVMRRLRNPRDLGDENDLADLRDFDPVQFLVQLEADQLQRSVGLGKRCFPEWWCFRSLWP